MLTRDDALKLAGETLQTDGPAKEKVAGLILEVQRQTAETCYQLTKPRGVAPDSFINGMEAAAHAIKAAFGLEPR